MSGINARKGPNVAQYIASLNTLPSAHDVASPQEDTFNIEKELAQFTNAEFANTDFLDNFDTGNFLEQPVPDFGAVREEQGKNDGTGNSDGMNVKDLGFSNDNFPFPDLNSFLPSDHPLPGPPQTQYNPSIPLYASSTSPLNFNPAPYPGQKHPLTSSSSPTAPTPTTTTTTPPSLPPQPPLDPSVETTASRLAAEEDKRRRNTAASARFRVKKKQREQALETTAKELENKALALEQRIGQLETENEWLRGLVVEKHGGEKEDLRLKWKRDGGKEGGKEERKAGEGKKGVGTGVENGGEGEKA